MKKSKRGRTAPRTFIRRAFRGGDVRPGSSSVLLALLLLAPGGVQADAAGDAQPPGLHYEVRLGDPFAETVHVSLLARGLPAGTLELSFLEDASPRDVRNASWAQGVLRAEVDPAATELLVEFDAPIAERSLGFALVRLAVTLPRPTNETLLLAPTRVSYVAPDGWVGLGPAGIDGFAAFGRDLKAENVSAGPTTIRIASATPLAPDELTYLTRGVPHIAAQHAMAPDEILVIRAPTEAVERMVAARPVLVIPADTPLEELARGMVRVHQRYRVVEVPPASAAWLREGQERYHALTSMLAANLTTAERAEQDLARARAVGQPNVTLPQSAAGAVNTRQKGLIVVRALDTAMRDASGGAQGLADLLADLEVRASMGDRVDSAQVEEAATRIAGSPLDAFFAAYVYGPEWPTTAPVARAADIFVRELRTEPARAAPGEQILAAFDAVNRGTQAGAVEVLVTLDGAPAGSTRVELEVGERKRVGTPVVATAPGDHLVAIGTLSTTFRVLTDPLLRLDRASTTPAEPAAGEPFTLLVYVRNDGEAAATASLEVREHTRLLQRTTNATVEGGETRAITLPMRLDDAGLHALDVELLSDAGEGILTQEVNVAPGASGERGAPGAGLMLVLAVLALMARAKRP